MSIALVGYLATLKKEKRTSSRDSSRTRGPLQTSADSNALKYDGKSFQRCSGELFDRLLPKPADVSKAIPDASRYAGKSDETFRSKYQVFLRACMITGLKETDHIVRLTVIEVVFLVGEALDFFQRSFISDV
jgi:hypothetical protein